MGFDLRYTGIMMPPEMTRASSRKCFPGAILQH